MTSQTQATIEAAHRYAAWAGEARLLRRAYKARFKAAHPATERQTWGTEVREPLCVSVTTPSGDGTDPESWCEGCRQASALRTQYLHAVRMRAAAGLKIERCCTKREG